jgi:23S rRNA pseudouridine1911/1915/1917 synthase
MSRRSPHKSSPPVAELAPEPLIEPTRVPPPESPDELDADLASADLGDEDWADATPPLPAQGANPPAAPSCSLQVERAQHGQRLDVFLAAGVPQYSRSHLKSLVEQGCVHVDGKQADSASRKVLAGQKVAVLLKPTAQSQAFVAEPMALPIVFEDAHLIVVNKPAGLVVHPAAGNWTGTLMNGLLAHHRGAVDLPRAGIVHRLDKDTSGLMVVGKTLAAVTALSRAIAAREVSRQYLALVHGATPDSFTVDAPIGRDPATRVRMAVLASGKPARTDVLRLLSARWPADEAAARTYSGVRCTLHSGRTHQIRVHLSSRKHPLVADAIYGGAQALGMARQALHATRLSFAHPESGQTMTFEADLPSDMAQAWQSLSDCCAIGDTAAK